MTKTEDHYYCRLCLHLGPADEIESPYSLTCSMCDSPDVVLESVRYAELRAERVAAELEADRIAALTPEQRAAEIESIRAQYPELYGAISAGSLTKRQAA